jgi:light-regulated signal transduction histidine kinase (bacteriophytochrome)
MRYFKHMGSADAEELRREVDDLRNLLNRLTHDLQEPVRAISSFPSLAEKIPSEAPVHLERVRVHAQCMDAMIRSTLDFLHLTTREGGPVEPIDLNLAVRGAVSTVQPLLDQSGATVLFPELPIVHGDPPLLHELFQNLLTNAVKYRGPCPPAIKITAQRGDAAWTIAVADKGSGIDPKYFEQIFKPFERLHRSRIPGTGLGLSICRYIVERHQGRIWVESTPGHGRHSRSRCRRYRTVTQLSD